MAGVAEDTTVEIGGVLIEDAALAVGIVIVAGLEGSGLIDDFADAAEVVSCVVVISGVWSTDALLTVAVESLGGGVGWGAFK